MDECHLKRQPNPTNQQNTEDSKPQPKQDTKTVMLFRQFAAALLRGGKWLVDSQVESRAASQGCKYLAARNLHPNVRTGSCVPNKVTDGNYKPEAEIPIWE